ncbi:MAG: amidohydrolase family protein [Gemmatimonadales bacterium]
MGRLFVAGVICTLVACASSLPLDRNSPRLYDLTIVNGRVMDPESGLDAVRNIGVINGTISTITSENLSGRKTINARGLVVSPGFIDLHQHDLSPGILRLKVADGVTSAFEMELGVSDIDEWYAIGEGKSAINFGAAIGHPGIRTKVLTGAAPLNDLPSGESTTRAATPEQLKEIAEGLRRGLERGALGIGVAIEYTPGARPLEILEIFRVAAEFPGASVHVHVRNTEPPHHWMETAELILGVVITGAPLHIVHANSSFGGDAPKLFEIIQAARSRGLDVTTETYPYITAATEIQSAGFDNWKTWSAERFNRFIWPPTGERLTRASFEKYRAMGGLVLIEGNTEEKLRPALTSPLTMIASDGGTGANNAAHPRIAGTYARVLGKYVREEKILTLMEALRKMTLMPAQRLENRATAMRNKGRIRVGADADITIFDPATVADRSTFKDPFVTSAGIPYVIVNGVPVVSAGVVDTTVAPGKGIRARVGASK